MTPSLEGSPTKAKEAPSLHEVRLAPLDTNPVFQCLGENLRQTKCSFYLTNLFIFTNQKPAFKIMAGEWSLTIIKTFVTTEKPC